MTDTAYKILVCEPPTVGTTTRVLLRHTPGAAPPPLSRRNNANPTGFVVMPRHPRYRLPDDAGLGTVMLDDTRGGVAASASAGDTALPIETTQDPVEGLELKVSAPGTPGLSAPEQAVIISSTHEAVVDADDKLLARVQKDLDDLAAWLDGQTWEISLEESQRCAICLVHRWHHIATSRTPPEHGAPGLPEPSATCPAPRSPASTPPS